MLFIIDRTLDQGIEPTILDILNQPIFKLIGKCVIQASIEFDPFLRSQLPDRALNLVEF